MKSKVRIIARLDIKAPNLIKGINLEGVRVVGDPQKFATDYYLNGIDEIIYMDAVATLYGRNNLSEVVMRTSENIFVPLTVGGGIRSLEDVDQLMASGADKVALNSAAIKNPDLISKIAKKYGSQAVVLSIEAKRIGTGSDWEAYIDNGREKTGIDVRQWVDLAVPLGVGEVLVTSVDQEGTQLGFDVELMKIVSDRVSIPVIASGGMGALDHASDVVLNGNVDAIAIGHLLHYQKLKLAELRSFLLRKNIEVVEHASGAFM